MISRSLLAKLSLATLSVGLILTTATSPAFAEHIQCGDLIIQDTTLDSDLVDCPGDGVVIGASGITLDLAGHTIDGTTTAGSAGVNNRAGHDGVSVTGGTIREFNRAIDYSGVQGGSLTQLDVVSFRTFLDDSTDILIERNVLDMVDMADSERIKISRNLVRRTIIARQTGDLLLDRNTVMGQNGRGIRLAGTPGAVVSRNVIATTNQNADSFAAGLSIENHSSGRPTSVDRNEISGSVTGLRLASATDVALTRNTLLDNTADGILATHSVRILIDRNRAERNGDDGIDVDVTSSTATISNNFANFNGDLGIVAMPGAIDGGGNKAHGNGNPLQCLNVRCK